MGSEIKTEGFFKRNRTVLVMGLLALIIAGTADLVAGFFLTTMEDYIVLVPGMMIMIYAAIGMRGNIFGAMGSRLGTSMHMGTFQMSFRKKSVLRSNIEASMVLTLVLSSVMGFIGWGIVELFASLGIFSHTVDIWKFTFISLVGGLLAGIVVIIFNILIAYVGYKRDWDVDNITAPLIAAVGDIATIPMIYIATWMVVDALEPVPAVIYAICGILLALTIVSAVLVLRRKTRRRRRMDEAKRIIKQSFPVLLACTLFEILAGIIIENATSELLDYAVLLVLLPAFLNEGNALSGMLTSRFSSMLHLGTIDSRVIPPKGAYENFLIMYILALVTFLYIGSIAFAVKQGGLPYGKVIAIILIAGALTVTVLNFLSYYVAILAVKFKLDPDDHCIPITSSLMDVIGTSILVAVIALFLL